MSAQESKSQLENGEGELPKIEAPELQINQGNVKDYEVNLEKNNELFIHAKLERSPSHSNLTPRKKNSFSRKVTLKSRKSRRSSFASVSRTSDIELTKDIKESSKMEGGPLVFSKNIFNYSTKLPKIVKKNSQNFYHKFYKNKSGKFSMPIIEKTPGMLNKAQTNKYIVKNRIGGGKRYVNYNTFSYKYRNVNLLSDHIKLTTGLFSKMRREADKNNKRLKIDDVDDPNLHIDDRLEIEYLKDNIPIADNVEPIDANQKDLEGMKAVESYYKHFKMLNKVEQLNKSNKTRPSVYTKLLKSTSQKRLLPLKMGIIKLGRSESALDLRHYSLGNEYGEIACKTTKDMEFEKINMENNRLSGEAAKRIIEEIEPSVKKVNLAHNNLGASVLAFGENITDIKSNLQFLNLSKCALGDLVTSQLFGLIKNSMNLKSINLSENNLTDNITDSVVDCFSKNQSLKEIYFRWNGLTAKFAGPFFRSIVESKEIMVLDLAYNHIGKGLKVIKEVKNKRKRRGRLQDIDVAEIIQEYLNDNDTLAHLDLSCNNFRLEECEKISEGLKVNHSVYGFHFDGNYGYVDSEGFLVMESSKNYSTMHGRKSIYGLEKVRHYNKLAQQVESVDTRNCCWICDGWMEMTFEYTGKLEKDQPVFILFKHEDFQPIYMSKEEGDEYPNVTLMVPDARIFFFYLVGFEIKVQIDAPKIFLAETDNLQFELLDQVYEYQVDLVNFMDVQGNVPPVFEEYEARVQSKPRFLRKQYKPTEENHRIWSFHNSIFRHFKKDNEYLLERCFEADWNNGRYKTFIKSGKERSKIREFLKKHYKKLKDFYKHYSSFSASRNFGIGQNLMIEIFSKMGAMDDKYLNIAALGIEMTKVNYTEKAAAELETNNSKNLICRYEFLELLVRCAHNKYMLSKLEDNYYSSLKRFFGEYVLKTISEGYDTQAFRDSGYWTEEVDHLYECYKPVLKFIYRKFAQEESSYSTISISELKSFIKTYSLDHLIPDREIPLIYRTSMMTCVDEVKSDRIFSMAFVEFLETLGRLAEKANMPPLSFTEEEATMLTDEDKAEFKLSLKIEALIVHIVKQIPREDLVKFKLPKGSVLTEEGDMPENFAFDYLDLA